VLGHALERGQHQVNLAVLVLRDDLRATAGGFLLSSPAVDGELTAHINYKRGHRVCRHGAHRTVSRDCSRLAARPHSMNINSSRTGQDRCLMAMCQGRFEVKVTVRLCETRSGSNVDHTTGRAVRRLRLFNSRDSDRVRVGVGQFGDQ